MLSASFPLCTGLFEPFGRQIVYQDYWFLVRDVQDDHEDIDLKLK